MAAEKTAINLLDEACDLVSCWRAMWQPFAKSLQSCPTLCDPINVSPPDSPVPGILQARTRVGCHFLLQCVKVKLLSHVRLSNPMDCSLPGSSIHGIFQARVLEWGAIAFSAGSPYPEVKNAHSQVSALLRVQGGTVISGIKTL